MIRHIVIIHFQKNLCDDYVSLMEKTKPFIEQIPGILSYKQIPNESHYVPKDVTSMGIEILFEDQKALDLFMNHPKHFEANKVFEKYLADPPFMVLTHEIKE